MKMLIMSLFLKCTIFPAIREIAGKSKQLHQQSSNYLGVHWELVLNEREAKVFVEYLIHKGRS